MLPPTYIKTITTSVPFTYLSLTSFTSPSSTPLQPFSSLSSSSSINHQLPHHRIQRRQSSASFYELQSSSSLFTASSFLLNTAQSSLPILQYDHVPQFVQEPYGSIRFSNLYGGNLPCSLRLVNTITAQPVSFQSAIWPGSMDSSSSVTSTTTSTSSSSLFTSNNNEWIEKIYWEVRDIRTLDDSHFSPAIELPGIREHRPDGSLAFLPFQDDQHQQRQQPSTSSSVLINNKSNNGGSGGGGSEHYNNNNFEQLHNALYRCVAVTNVGIIASRSILVTFGKYLYSFSLFSLLYHFLIYLLKKSIFI